MKRKILPYTPPIYCAYNYMGALNVCGQNDERMEEWILGKCTLWKYNVSEHRLSILNSSVLSEIPFMHQHYMWKKHIKENYSDIFKALIDDDFYISYTNVDDFYILSTRSYEKSHFPHDGLIYGYDEENYYVSAYDATRKYTCFEVPMEMFDKAWHSKYNKSVEEELGEGTIVALRLNDTIEYKADVNEIIDDIKKYITSANVDKSSKSTVFGFDVYRAIEKRIEAAIYGEIVDNEAILFKVFLEHKMMMNKRIEYLFKNIELSESILEDYKKILKLSEKTRMIYLKYTFTKNKELLFTIKDNINTIAEEEVRLLTEITSSILV